jgi:hypothetical protein
MNLNLLLFLYILPFISISNPKDDIKQMRYLFIDGKYESVLSIVAAIESIKNKGDVVGYSSVDKTITNSPEYQHYKLSSIIHTKGLHPSKELVFGYDKLYRLDNNKQFIEEKYYKDLIILIKKQSASSYKALHYQTTKMYVDALARWGDTTDIYKSLYKYRSYKDKIFPTKTIAEAYYHNYDYSAVDKLALSVNSNDIETLTWLLTKDFEYKHEKIRALYTWVTKNISYDYTFKSDSYRSTFNSKKGTCAGYTELLSLMFDYANIESYIVIGNADNGNPNDRRLHGWSVIKLSGYDFWLDSTWDAVHGYKYFLVDPPKLKTHKELHKKKPDISGFFL